jgi:hypothetical protein
MAVICYFAVVFYMFLLNNIHVNSLTFVKLAAESACDDSVASNNSLYVDVKVKFDANLLVGVVVSVLFEWRDKRLC